MNYARSVKFIFESPRWWVTILLGLLCLMIPLVGPVVFVGYGVTLFKNYHQSKQDRLIAFDFAYFIDYLKSGIWPILGVFIFTFVSIFLFAAIVGIILALGYYSNVPSELLGILLWVVIIVFYIPFIFFVTLASIPMAIGAAVGLSLRDALNPKFILDFIRLMWAETLVSVLFLAAVGFCAMFAGMFLCFVGTYLAMPFMMIVQWHLHWQLYETYLEKKRVV
ncbi:MAG: DUF4013 domain-containing protein [Deltaproteobacteria bacterium]|nr:DUF4013 domain-containing protein [Deltaproteobacteria bacterium]